MVSYDSLDQVSTGLKNMLGIMLREPLAKELPLSLKKEAMTLGSFVDWPPLSLDFAA